MVVHRNGSEEFDLILTQRLSPDIGIRKEQKRDLIPSDTRESYHQIIALDAETKMIANAWMRTGDNATYQAKGWGKSRRIVVVRKDVEKFPKCGGKTLFSHEDDYLRYRYSVYVTNSELSDDLIWVTYKHGAEAENQIKVLKYDYAMEGFCFKEFHATEIAFRWVMMAYNLMSYVRNKIAVSKVKHTLLTLKFRCIAIGAYLVSSGRQKKLMFDVSGSKRDYIEGLFEKIRRIGSLPKIPTA
jgi:hypothetical protein